MPPGPSSPVASASAVVNEVDVTIQSDLNRQPNGILRLLRELIEREHQKANPADLSGFLTSGVFRSKGSRVSGYWRISRALIENLLGGS